MRTLFKTALAVTAVALASQAFASITFYEQDRFEGRSFTTAQRVGNLQRAGFNDRASSVVVGAGERWEVCEDARFQGNCAVLRPGWRPRPRACRRPGCASASTARMR